MLIEILWLCIEHMNRVQECELAVANDFTKYSLFFDLQDLIP